MMPRFKTYLLASAAASARLLATRILTQPTRICADSLRAFFETVTSSSAFVAWMLWVALFLVLGHQVSGQVLDQKPHQRFPSHAPIAWENLTTKSFLVDGETPTWSSEDEQYVVALSPGQHTDFLLRPHEMIRAVDMQNQSMKATGIEIWVSDGSGLLRKQNVAHTEDARSVIAAPDYPSWTFVRIKRPDYANGPGIYAIYTSRRAMKRGLDAYEYDLLNMGTQVEVTTDANEDPRTYHKIRPGRRVVIGDREGDSRVRFETRLEYNQDRQQARSYWMKVYANGSLQRIVTYETLPERYDRWFVNDLEKLLGRREFAYLEFSAMDVVEVEFSHACYLRVEALGLKLARAKANVDLLQHLQKGLAGGNTSEMKRFDPWLHHPQLLDIARDNSNRQGGLNAYMLMRAAAAHQHGAPDYRDEITVPEMARKIRGRFTQFRDLLPSSSGVVQPRHVRFPVRSIRDPSQPSRQVTLGSQHIAEAASQLPKAMLYPVSIEGQDLPGKLTYRVPQNLGPSVLRMIVDKSTIKEKTSFTVQYDDRPPIHFQAGPHSTLDSRLLKPAYQEAALLAFASRFKPFDGSSLGGPFASLNRNADSTVAATHEFLIPAGIRKVTLQSESATADPTLVGLQYLTSRYQRLSESEWFYHQQELLSGDPVRVAFSKRILKNQAFDLTSMYDSHLSTIGASIERPPATNPLTLNQPDHGLLIAEANDLKRRGNLPAFVEATTEIIKSSTGELKRKAQLARADAMREMGEFFMSERELRGLMAFANDPKTRRMAMERLLNNASLQPFNELQIEQYMTYNMLNTQGADERDLHSLALAKQFAENDRHRMAFFAHPPRPNQPLEQFHFRSLLQLRWPRMLDSFAQQSPNEQANLWKGLNSIQLGNIDSGLAYLQDAGPEGAKWIDHWNAALAIHEQLKSPTLEKRMESLSQWEQWHASHPGPRVWEPAPDLILRSRGAAHILSPSRNLRSQFFIASNTSPAVIEVCGPSTIRLEMRPIHPNETHSRFDEWFTVSAGEKQGYVAALGNTPSQQLRIDGVDSWVPGRIAQTQIRVPTGLHRIRLASRNNRFLFRVMQDQPEVKLPALPPITPSTLTKVISGDYGTMMVVESGNDDDRDYVRVLDSSGSIRSHSIGKLADPFDNRSLQQAWRWLTTKSISLANANRIRAMPNQLPFEQTEQDDIYSEAAEIAYLIDNRPGDHEHRLQAIALLQKLYDKDTTRADIKSLLNHAKSGTVWRKHESFDQRAGTRSVDLTHWTPESPELRVRSSLAGLNRATWVVTGKKEAIIEVSDQRTMHMRLKLRRPAVGFIPMTNTNAIIEIGDKRRIVEVGAENFEQVDFVLPAGEHQIRVAQDAAWANHFLHIEAFEILDDGTEAPFGFQHTKGPTRSRTWMVAQPEDPIKFSLRGPGLYRIDRLVDGRSQSKVIALPDNELRRFTIYPDEGRKQELVRIFELVVTGDPTAIYSRQQHVQQPSTQQSEALVQAVWNEPALNSQFNVPDNFDDLALLSPDVLPSIITARETEELGWQETGTLAGGFGYVLRRAADELDDSSGSPGQFTQLGLTRFLFDQGSDTYSRSQYLMRPRLSGGNMSFGMNHQQTQILRLNHFGEDDPNRNWGPIQITWRSGMFGQTPGTPLVGGVSSFPWTVFGGGGISRRQTINEHLYRTPRLQMFGRYLSEERDGWASGVLDQDVFTRYKADHRYGLRLSDQWVYQNCIDRRFWMRPMLVTNPDQLVPDNLGVYFGIDQMLGPVQLRWGYRLTGYFADNDRSNAVVQNLFDFEAMLETWQSRNWRTEARFSIRHDVSNGGTSILFNLRGFFNQGRGYRDMSPQSMLFRSIRQDRALRHLMVQPPDAFVH